ncbi:MAG: hypothetical protein Q7V58_11235 [Actinomycetota bacterium]|nr:hypothetical protein [Actinomycetota bacterium]
MPVENTADVNWLLSAITQSAAALIAIVGGLLVSRYVSLHAEQQGARRRADDLQRREVEAQAQLEQCLRDIDLYYVDDFLDDDVVFKSIIRQKGGATVDEVLADKDTDGGQLNLELLAEQLASLEGELVAASVVLRQEVIATKEHVGWVDFKRGKDFEVGHRGVWEWVYDRICDEKRRVAKREEDEARRKSQFGSLLGPTIDYSQFRFDNPQLRGIRSVVSSQHEIAHINVLRGRVETARAEVRALQQERRLAEELFEATRQPEGFGLALQVLATLAVLGMGVPVVIMAFVPYSLPVWLRAIVVVLFFLGVGLLLRFLFVYAHYLRGSRKSLPSRLVGLLTSDEA